MTLRQSSLGAGFFCFATLAAFAANAQTQQPGLCERDIAGWLDELKVDRSTVTNIYASTVRTLEGGSAGITGWVSLNTCRGKIVFNMGSSCRRFETYTTGECRLPGVSSY
jgi:hypothetical protein